MNDDHEGFSSVRSKLQELYAEKSKHSAYQNVPQFVRKA